MESTPETKKILQCRSGRMVILERAKEAEATTAAVSELARAGKEEGYVLYAENALNTLGQGRAPGLFICLLVRPSLHAERAGQLSAMAAVAVARAIEKVSDIDVRIRWVNDLYHRTHKLAAAMTQAQIRPNGYLDYAAIGVSLALSPEDFPPKLGDVIRHVFEDGVPSSLPDRLAEMITLEFFNLYDRLQSDSSYLEEYRRRSLLLGHHVRVLHGGGYRRGRVVGIDNFAGLIVEFKNARRVTVYSRSEVVL